VKNGLANREEICYNEAIRKMTRKALQMFIPAKWKSKITGHSASNGWSPAKVTKLDVGNHCFYLKSSDVKFSATTYSVKREREVTQWLSGKLIVPEVIDFGVENNRDFMVLSALEGTYIDELKTDPDECILHFARLIKLLHSVDISNCPFDSKIDARLTELSFLIQNGLASDGGWDAATPFTDTTEFYQWLCTNKPMQEELVFSHGDLTANVFLNGSDYCFYDLGRAGVADKWLDIAFCVSDIRSWIGDKKYEDKFFELLDMEPNYEKIEYYILLDEMF